MEAKGGGATGTAGRCTDARGGATRALDAAGTGAALGELTGAALLAAEVTSGAGLLADGGGAVSTSDERAAVAIADAEGAGVEALSFAAPRPDPIDITPIDAATATSAAIERPITSGWRRVRAAPTGISVPVFVALAAAASG